MGQVVFDVKAADFFSSATMPMPISFAGTSTPVTGLQYTPASNQYAFYRFTMPSDYVTGTITVNHAWYSAAGSTTGAVVWEDSIAAITPGDAQSVETKAQATANTASATTVTATAKALTNTANAMSSNLDSIAAGDNVLLKVLCKSTGSTITGAVNLVGLSISY